jgi:hypothetical protein
MLWTQASPETYDRLALQRGWPAPRPRTCSGPEPPDTQGHNQKICLAVTCGGNAASGIRFGARIAYSHDRQSRSVTIAGQGRRARSDMGGSPFAAVAADTQLPIGVIWMR